MRETEWARRMAQGIKADKARKAEEDAETLEGQRIKNQFASKLWTDVRVAFKNKAQLFNDEVGEEILTWEAPRLDTFSLRRNDIHECMTVSYQEARYEIKVELLGRSVPLEVVLDHTSGKACLHDSSSKLRDPEQLAEEMIEELLKKH